MDDVYYAELKIATKEAAARRKTQSQEENDRETEEFFSIGEQLARFSLIGRKEGLLALEEAGDALDEKEHPWTGFFKNILILIVDGTDPECVEESGFAQIWNEPDEANRLYELIVLRGLLGIQGGESPYYQERLIPTMYPKDVYEAYRARKNETEQKSKHLSDDLSQVKQVIDKIGEQTPKRSAKDSEYFVLELFDYLVMQMSDIDIRTWLRMVKNSDIELALKLVGGPSAKRILENLPERLAAMILEDMDFMGPVRIRDCVASINKMLESLLKLMDCGEVKEPGQELIKALLNLFHTADELPNWTERSRLYSLLQEYETAKERRIR